MERKRHVENRNKDPDLDSWQCDTERKLLQDVCLRLDYKKAHKICQSPKCGVKAIERLPGPKQALNSSSLLGTMSYQTGTLAMMQRQLCELIDENQMALLFSFLMPWYCAKAHLKECQLLGLILL